MTLQEFVIRIGAAILFGAIIGIERQWRQRMAGLRTNVLVAAGSTIFVSLGVFVVDELSPTRVAAQIVSGIGFLGGGIIFREGLSVRGINTAATIWCTAAIGSIVGFGYIYEAGIATAAIVATNTLFRPLARKIDRTPLRHSEVETEYELRVYCHSEQEFRIRDLLLSTAARESLRLRELFSKDTPEENTVLIKAKLIVYGREDAAIEKIMSRLSIEKHVSGVSWTIVEVDHRDDNNHNSFIYTKQ